LEKSDAETSHTAGSETHALCYSSIFDVAFFFENKNKNKFKIKTTLSFEKLGDKKIL
jgi:hypothetical protein